MDPKALEEAFWEALVNRCDSQEYDYPWHDRPRVDGYLLPELWERMADVLDERNSSP